MKLRAQIAMVLNLDKCIGCHTCSVVCKNVWTNRKGIEYAWFNNVESKPGIGYPKNWEDQAQWRGGWQQKGGRLELKSGGRAARLLNLFANPDLPEIDDYAEPVDYDYGRLQNAPLSEAAPTARPRSQIDGHTLDKVTWGSNWEDDLAGPFEARSKDVNFKNIAKEIYGEFEHAFQLYLPRLCNHCLNPACVAACPSGSLYKREEDGIVLVDQEQCRGWRMCVSGCPYKKVYYNWESGKAEKCLLCYPRIEAGEPTNCSVSCVGRIRYMGVVFYDADRIAAMANTTDPQQLYPAQMAIFLDPHDPQVISTAQQEGISQSWIEAAQNSPVWKMAMDWKIAFPLHPEFRTLPMVWYVPPLSPIQSRLDSGELSTGAGQFFPDAGALRLPVRYLANFLTAGDEAPVLQAIQRLLAMRAFQRGHRVQGRTAAAVAQETGLDAQMAQAMYRLLALAPYEERFVIPTACKETRLPDAYRFQGENGVTFGNNAELANGCQSSPSLFPQPRTGGAPVPGYHGKTKR